MMGLLIADPWTRAKCLSSLIRAENFKYNKYKPFLQKGNLNVGGCRTCKYLGVPSSPPCTVVQELLVRSLLIGCRKQWLHSFNCFSIVWGRVRHHWWLLFWAAATWLPMYVEEYMSYQWCALAIKPTAVLKSQSSQKYTTGALGNLAWSPSIIYFFKLLLTVKHLHTTQLDCRLKVMKFFNIVSIVCFMH